VAFVVRRFSSDEVLARTVTREAAESFVDDYVTEHGGVLMIEEEPMVELGEVKGLTRQQAAAALEVIALVGQLVKESPNGEVPSGELYARLMDKFSLETYERMIKVLIRSGLIERKFHLLRWIGDKA